MTDGEFDDALNDALAVVNDTVASGIRPGVSDGRPYDMFAAAEDNPPNTGPGAGANRGGGSGTCDGSCGRGRGEGAAASDRPADRSSDRPSDRPEGTSADPVDPVGPVDPAEPVGPAGPAEPFDSFDPFGPLDLTDTTRSTRTTGAPSSEPPASPAPTASPAPPGPPALWSAAREIAAGAVPGPPAPVTSALSDALGRTLAASLTALTDLPSFDTSAMDGWAVAGPGPWHIDGPADPEAHPGILAGHVPTEALPDGHAIRIATGARIPSGATAVLRSEHGEVRDLGEDRARLSAPRPAPPGQDIRPRGQECRRGDQLLPAGALVTPAVLGLAAAAGYDELTVYPRPRVDVFVLGDELLQQGLPEDGRIRDALGPMLGPWLRALGAEAAPPRPLADDADTLYAAIADSTADVVITTGGTASGPVDHVHPTLRRLGAEVLVDGVAVRPGHPMLLARLTPRRYLVGLPGNPLAAVSGLLTLAEPLLRTLAARRRATAWRTPLAGAVQGHPHDTRLVPVAYRDDDRDGLTAAPLHFNGPAMLRGIAAADALAVVPPGGAGRGAEVELLELPWSAGWSMEGAGPDHPYGSGTQAPGSPRAGSTTGGPEEASPGPDGPHPGPGGVGNGSDPVRSTFPVPPSGGAA
ncbi:molybdopterin molybdotransferase MoeA [Streptomyces sp. NPDC093589]|uniref:molybdopterin molybdotransferase MoeA n=1 Tax=Streptomyces sp. NPDC093589 TaxID=3366043 RepID=UPI00381462F9